MLRFGKDCVLNQFDVAGVAGAGGRRAKLLDEPELEEMFQFRLKTLVIATVVVGSLAAMSRWELAPILAGLGVLFAVFVFAEDIWPRVPR